MLLLQPSSIRAMADRIKPDRMALEIAHKKMCTTMPLDKMLEVEKWRRILENMARKHMKQRAKFDIKMIQANDEN